MVKIDYDIGHKSAKNLAITIPSTVTPKTVRISDKGDQYAEAIYKSGSGGYAQIAAAFDKIAKYCNTALNNTAIAVKATKEELKAGKKNALSKAKWARKRREQIQFRYEQTKDIFNLINQ
jgi:alcohol dehydrogenase YqhD (iron-dependent ADH family)